jgi:hypothetical protein
MGPLLRPFLCEERRYDDERWGYRKTRGEAGGGTVRTDIRQASGTVRVERRGFRACATVAVSSRSQLFCKSLLRVQLTLSKRAHDTYPGGAKRGAPTSSLV